MVNVSPLFCILTLRPLSFSESLFRARCRQREHFLIFFPLFFSVWAGYVTVGTPPARFLIDFDTGYVSTLTPLPLDLSPLRWPGFSHFFGLLLLLISLLTIVDR